MNAITTNAIIGSISSRVDGSIGFKVSTPELNDEQKLAFLNLHNKNVTISLTPMDEPIEKTIKIDSEAGEKTPSERLRNKLYVRWTNLGTDKTFDEYYRVAMNGIIDQIEV